jgi:hypothetical protein
MQTAAFIANTAWMAANLPSYVQFRRALQNPAAAQRRKLLELIQRNANTEFGKKHKFTDIASYADFARHVPISNYNQFEPWITRIQAAEQRVLTTEPVTRLVPTSGSSGARKLIPFTANLQNEFNAAVGPWLVDLARQFPAIMGGPAYWSISPTLGDSGDERSAIPIGFDSDLEYLSAMRRRFARAIMAVPSSIARAKSLDEFHWNTWLHLLQAAELRLISIWHPTFLTLLLDALPSLWNDLLKKLPPTRARELTRAPPAHPKTFWPKLALISCWGDVNAHEPLRALQNCFPGVAIQPKGLLATEGVVTLPFAGRYPVAITSHFFEFIDSSNSVFTIDEIQTGEEYEVVLTTSGGFWRYRLGDRVRVTGALGHTPTLEFLGRTNDVSDRCGEKLSEQFVRESLRELFGASPVPFALLAPEPIGASWRYTLFVENSSIHADASHLDALLRRNPHYAYCRDLGQLHEPSIHHVEHGFRMYVLHCAANGAKLGDIKPTCLSSRSDWAQVFHRSETRSIKAPAPVG